MSSHARQRLERDPEIRGSARIPRMLDETTFMPQNEQEGRLERR